MCFYGIWPILSYFDLFQNHISLFFNNRIKRTTKIGFLFTLFLIILLAVYFSQSDLIVKKSPYVVSQKIKHFHANPINFDSNHLMSISISDDNNVNYLDPQIFEVVFTIYNLKSSDEGIFELISQENLELQPCSKEDVKFDSNVFAQLGLKNALCLKNKTFLLEGYWDESFVHYADVQLFPCDNSTKVNQTETCKSIDEIQAFFQITKYFGAIFHSVALIVDNYLEPIVPSFEYIFQSLDLKFIKYLSVYFQQIELTTNDAWLFSSKNTQSNFLKDYVSSDVGSRSNFQDLLAKITLYAGHDIQQNTRRYQSLTEVLAYMAGLANFYIIICCVFTNIQNYVHSMKIILNSLYFFPNTLDQKENEIDTEKKEHKSIHKKEPNEKQFEITQMENTERMNLQKENVSELSPPSFMKIKDSKFTTNENPDLFTKVNIKILKGDSFVLSHYSQNDSKCLESRNKNKIEEINHNNEQKKCNKLKLGFLEFVRYLLALVLRCQKTEKQRLIQKANKIFMKEFDIINILKKIHEIEKLKLIILNEDQLVLFNSLAKPLIYLEDAPETIKSYEGNSALKMTHYIKNYKDNSRKTKFDLSYENIVKFSNLNEMNKRLLDLVDKNIENFKKNIYCF